MNLLKNIFSFFFGNAQESSFSREHDSDASQCPFLNGTLAAPEVVVEPELSEIQKIRKTFNSSTDLIAVSRDYVAQLEDPADKDWLEKLADRVIYFEGKTLVNIGVIKTGSTYYKN